MKKDSIKNFAKKVLTVGFCVPVAFVCSAIPAMAADTAGTGGGTASDTSVVEPQSTSTTGEAQTKESSKVVTPQAVPEKQPSVTETNSKTDNVTKLTNQDDYSKKTVYTISNNDAVKANENVSASAKDFLDSTNSAADFAVYADTLDKTIGHEDGNIAVNHLNNATTIMNKENQYASDAGPAVDKAYAKDGYSYVGHIADGKSVTTSSNQRTDGKNDSLLVTGPSVDLEKNTDANGTANHFRGISIDRSMVDDSGKITDEGAKKLIESDDRLSNIKEVTNITSNLKIMAENGEKLIKAASESSSLSSLDKITAVNKVLEAGKLNNDAILTVTVGGKLLRGLDENRNDISNSTNIALAKLVNNNKNLVNVVVNVDINADDVAISTDSDGKRTFTVLTMMNDINNYDKKGAYLTWNFGTFDGIINLGYYSGVVVAPYADLRTRQLESGRAVGKIVSHKDGEIHTAVTGNFKSQKPTEPDNTTPSKPDNTTPSKPDNTTPSKPDNTTPSKPDNTTPSKPDNTTPSKPDSTTPSKPDSTTPSKPDTTPSTPVVTPTITPTPSLPSENTGEKNNSQNTNPKTNDNQTTPGTNTGDQKGSTTQTKHNDAQDNHSAAGTDTAAGQTTGTQTVKVHAQNPKSTAPAVQRAAAQISTSTASASAAKSTIPRTADETRLGTELMLFGGAAALLALLLAVKRRKVSK